MKSLDLYYFPQCPYCQLVLNVLKETGLENKVNYHDIHKNPSDKQKLVQDTGRGTVPCLYIDEKPMHESADISNWLKMNAAELK